MKTSFRVGEIDPAGYYNPKLPTDTTKYALMTDHRLPTPHEIKKWRITYNDEPGVHTVHPGLIDDRIQLENERSALPLECQTFGNKILSSDHVPQIFSDQIKGPATKFMDEAKENVYASKKREPLGRVALRGHELPSQCKDPNFSFGLPTVYSETAKNLIYPNEIPPIDETTHKQYVKTHNSFNEAEQRTRNYNWPEGVTPENYRFGQKDITPYEESRYCVNPKKDPNLTIPHIVRKEIEDQKLSNNSDNRCRPTGLTMGYNSSTVFGKPGKDKDEWGVMDCVQGNFSVKDQLPDEDIGRSTRPGYRNVTTETRAFGIPTVRYDIREPTLKSIADNQNYGNDLGAYNLTNPDAYISQGLADVEFSRPKNENDIKKLFEKIGYGVTDEEFNKIINHAKGLPLTGSGEVSIQEYRKCLNEYLSYKDEGMLPKWWT